MNPGKFQIYNLFIYFFEEKVFKMLQTMSIHRWNINKESKLINIKITIFKSQNEIQCDHFQKPKRDLCFI